MKAFEYTIKDNEGIHARPAGLLVKEIVNYESAVSITSNATGKKVKASSVMMLMTLGVKKGMTITVTVEGADEDTAAAGIQAFLEANL